jgi:hypothetical protein
VIISVGVPLVASPGESAESLTERTRVEMQAMLEEAQASYPVKPANDDDRWWLPDHLGGTAPTPAEAWKADQAETEAKALKRAERLARKQGGSGKR